MVLKSLLSLLALRPLVLPLVAYYYCLCFVSTIIKVVNILQGEVQSTLTFNNWARYINKINKQDLTRLITIITSRVYT